MQSYHANEEQIQVMDIVVDKEKKENLKDLTENLKDQREVNADKLLNKTITNKIRIQYKCISMITFNQ